MGVSSPEGVYVDAKSTLYVANPPCIRSRNMQQARSRRASRSRSTVVRMAWTPTGITTLLNGTEAVAKESRRLEIL